VEAYPSAGPPSSVSMTLSLSDTGAGTLLVVLVTRTIGGGAAATAVGPPGIEATGSGDGKGGTLGVDCGVGSGVG